MMYVHTVCPECGEQFPVGFAAVKEEELNALVERWLEIDRNRANYSNIEIANGYMNCAYELKKLYKGK